MAIRAQGKDSKLLVNHKHVIFSPVYGMNRLNLLCDFNFAKLIPWALILLD